MAWNKTRNLQQDFHKIILKKPTKEKAIFNPNLVASLEKIFPNPPMKTLSKTTCENFQIKKAPIMEWDILGTTITLSTLKNCTKFKLLKA